MPQTTDDGKAEEKNHIEGQVSALHDSDAFGELQGELEEETLQFGFMGQELLQNIGAPNPQQVVHPVEQRLTEKHNPRQINEPDRGVRRREPRQP